jgi:hypothetical protein
MNNLVQAQHVQYFSSHFCFAELGSLSLSLITPLVFMQCMPVFVLFLFPRKFFVCNSHVWIFQNMFFFICTNCNECSQIVDECIPIFNGR